MEQSAKHIGTNTTKRVITIISLFGGVILLMALLWMYTAGLIMSLSAYVEGEGYYSKYQKDSITHLTQFIQEQDPKYYWMYREAIAVPIGSRIARIELEKESPDMDKVTEGLIQARNHPDNVDRIIRLYRNYRNTGFMDTAIRIWIEADELVLAIDSTASIIYEEVISGQPNNLRLADLVSQIYSLNGKLSPVQNHFTSHMGKTARQIESMLNIIVFMTIGLLLIIAGISTRRILKNIRQSESDLLQSREQYRKIYENALEGIVQSTTDGRFISANPALVSILGYDSEEELIQSTNSIDKQFYVDAGRRDEIIRIIEKEGEAKNMVSRMYRKDGSIIWIEESTLCIYDDDSNPLYLEGTVQDITGKKEAEIELLKRDNLLRAVADATNRLIIAPDVNDGISEALRILGLASEVDRVCIFENQTMPGQPSDSTSVRYEWCGNQSLSLANNEASQQIQVGAGLAWYKKLVTGKPVMSTKPAEVARMKELPLHHDARSQLIVPMILKDKLWGFVCFDDCSTERTWTVSEAGILQAMAGTIGNFIEKQMVEEDLRNSEKQFRELVESINDVIFQTDEFGNWSFANSSWTEITGFSREDLMGKRFIEFIHPDDRSTFEKHFKSLVNSEVWYFEDEFRFRVKDGSIRWMELFARLVLDNDGLVTGVTGSLSDITEQRRSEQLVKESLHEKEVLLKEIHHRVKNNMAIISGLLHLKSDLVDNEDTRILLQESSNRIRSMAMIHEMLYQNETFASIDFSAYIRSLVEIIDTFYKDEMPNVSIGIETGNIVLDINDAVPCGLILNELITNAYKHAFNKHKRGMINVSFVRSGNEYRLTVSDNGKGLPENLRPENASSLGMNLITGLTGQLKGNLKFRNGKGATFILTFSRGSRQKANLPAKEKPAEEPGLVTGKLSPKKVMAKTGKSAGAKAYSQNDDVPSNSATKKVTKQKRADAAKKSEPSSRRGIAAKKIEKNPVPPVELNNSGRNKAVETGSEEKAESSKKGVTSKKAGTSSSTRKNPNAATATNHDVAIKTATGFSAEKPDKMGTVRRSDRPQKSIVSRKAGRPQKTIDAANAGRPQKTGAATNGGRSQKAVAQKKDSPRKKPVS